MKLCKMRCLCCGDVEHFLFTIYVNSVMGLMYRGRTFVVEEVK
jgi:hypothetical protein